MTRRLVVVAAAVMSILLDSTAGAQAGGATTQVSGRPGAARQGGGGRAGAGQVLAPGRAGAGRRGAAAPLAQERVIQQTVARLVRNRLGLNDDQMVKVREIDTRFTRQRAELDRAERQTRNALGMAMANGGRGGSDGRINLLLDSLRLGLLQGRLNVDRGELTELRGVLSPRQLAQFYFIREQVRRTVDSAATVPVQAADTSGRGRRGRGG